MNEKVIYTNQLKSQGEGSGKGTVWDAWTFRRLVDLSDPSLHSLHSCSQELIIASSPTQEFVDNLQVLWNLSKPSCLPVSTRSQWEPDLVLARTALFFWSLTFQWACISIPSNYFGGTFFPKEGQIRCQFVFRRLRFICKLNLKREEDSVQ